MFYSVKTAASKKKDKVRQAQNDQSSMESEMREAEADMAKERQDALELEARARKRADNIAVVGSTRKVERTPRTPRFGL